MANKQMIDAMWDDSPVDVSTEVNFIWSIANKLRGPYRSDKYKDVIIPMTIIRRFECALAPTKQKVVEQFKANPNFPAKAMYRISGFQFYNTSEFDLAELVNDADHIAANFKSYLQGFSANVLEVLMSKERGLNFGEEIDKMDKNNRLLSVIKEFSELDLDPCTIDNVKMGYIFEELIRKFSENAEAGDHYTGRDIIKLMVNILLAEGCDDIFDDGKVITILDQACGTGGMLSTGYNFIKRYNPSADVRLFGQEINPESYAMCLAEMLIKGQNAENICYQDTMKADRFKGTKMRFVLENPPFGTAWGGKDAAEGVEDAVNAEYQKGFDGRWGAGLPGSGDMQMLFLQSAIDKMDDNFGRAAIIENGSPLFSGGTASGESQIRRWMLESDLIEAIIALPTDLFYNTGIATYIWVLSKNKRRERKGKIQLIDASTFFKKLRKALGDKKNEISPEDRSAVTKLYADFAENEYCKIYRNEEFIYREYTVMQPLQRSYAITEERIQAMVGKGALDSLYNEVKFADLELMEERDGKARKQLNKFFVGKPIYNAILADLNHAISDTVWMSPDAFMPHLAKVLSKATTDKKLLGKIADGLSVMDKKAEIQRDRKGNILYDKETRDTELVKWEESIEDYMAREVLPHIPDAAAFFEESLGAKKPVIKTGAEIPFTRYFYKYQQPIASEELEAKFSELELSVSERVAKLFEYGGDCMREMKDSGFEWLGEVSSEIELVPLKYLLKKERMPIKVGPFGSQLSGADFLKEESGFWVYNQRTVLDENYEFGDAYISYEKYETMSGFHVYENDILITTRGTIGKITRIPHLHKPGILHPCIIRFRIDDSRYNYHLLKLLFNQSDFVISQILYKSNATTIEVIYSDTLKNIILPVWDMKTQGKLADFLDAKCAEIDALTADIQTQIDTLEQYKRSIITETVTKGLNPNAEMKDSGIEWVGEIPVHWSVHPVYSYYGERKNKNRLGKEDNLLSLSYGRVIRKDINTNDGLLPESFNTYNIVEAGDIIIRPTDLQNDKRSLRTGLVKEHGIITSAYIDLCPLKRVDSRYFHFLLHAYDVMKVFYNMGNGVHQGLNYSEFSRLMVFEPPYGEQVAMADYLETKVTEVDAIIEQKKEQMVVLDAYKRSLIFEYVTGKKEVPIS